MSSLAQCILLLISLCLGDIFVVAQPRSRAKSKPPETSDNVTQKAATFFESGQEAHAAGKFEEAVKLYSQAITLDSSLWQAEFQRASAYFSLHRWPEARTSIAHVIEQLKEFTASPELKQTQPKCARLLLGSNSSPRRKAASASPA